jgi:hypothetical protein
MRSKILTGTASGADLAVGFAAEADPKSKVAMLTRMREPAA